MILKTCLFSERIGVFAVKTLFASHSLLREVIKMKNVAIKENHLYNKAYKRGKRSAGKYAAVYVLRDLKAHRVMLENPEKKYLNRLGIAVSKKIGNAVKRNRAKRIIRAAYRAIEAELSTGQLVVISARSTICGVKSTDVERELREAFKRLDMYKKKVPSEKTENNDK